MPGLYLTSEQISSFNRENGLEFSVTNVDMGCMVAIRIVKVHVDKNTQGTQKYVACLNEGETNVPARYSVGNAVGQITTAFTGDLHCAVSLRSPASLGA